MKTTKRIISAVLLLAMLLGMVPVMVHAEDTSATVENGSTTIEGTNSFGSLLSEDIQEQQTVEDEAYSGGYTVVDLVIESGVATVEYSSLEEAVLVVSLYTEDGLQLLVSGKTVVQPEETEAIIALEGELPQYFMASAYLLDTYDYSPLCASYSTPMYTKEMQELLASTVDDYDEDKVLNLDEDKNTNFAVYEDTVKILDYAEGINTVISADDETLTYVIGNADSNITSLQAGDILAYAYGEDELLIVKVASATVDGTTVTIAGADLEMEEVFSHVKLENTGDAANVVVDDSALDEGVTFEGLMQEGTQTYGLRSIEGEGSVKNYLHYKIDEKYEKKNDSDIVEVEGKVEVKGTLGLELNLDFSYYVTLTRQFMKFETDVGVKLAVEISGEVDINIPFGDFSVMFFGVSIGFKPSINFKVEGKIEISCFIGFAIGYIYDNRVGLLHRDTTPKVEFESKIEASVFLGIDMNPKIDVLKGVIAKAELHAPIGFELKAEKSKSSEDEPIPADECIHGCKACVAMELNFKVELSAKISFLKLEKLTLKTKVKAVEFKISDFYWSLDHGEFGVGECPYKNYKVTVLVKNSKDKVVSNAGVVVTSDEDEQQTELGETNANGVLSVYLPIGEYTFSTVVAGKTLEKSLTVKEACKLTLDKNTVAGIVSPAPEVDKDAITDYGTVVASGECGAEGDNLLWTLYSGGLLTITGTGEMVSGNTPWENYKNQIKTVKIGDGVTTIGDSAFFSCISLTSVNIPNSVISIGNSAFRQCDSLTSVIIPASVSYISDDYAFGFCDNLTGIWVDINNTTYSNDEAGVLFNKDKTTLIQAPCGMVGSYTIPDSVTAISGAAFYTCEKITDIFIPNTISTINRYTFAKCNSLISLTIPNSVENIYYRAFFSCDKLSSVTIGNSVTMIEDKAFENCDRLSDVYVTDPNAWCKIQFYSENANPMYYANRLHVLNENGEEVTELILNSTVTTIPDYAFKGFNSLTTVIIPESVVAIGKEAFYSCDNLGSVTIGNRVTTIGGYAFYGCGNLFSVMIPEGVTEIGAHAFEDCDNLATVSIPSTVTALGGYAFCSSGIASLVIPDGVERIPDLLCQWCENLTRVVVGKDVTYIGIDAFAFTNLQEIVFVGDAPTTIKYGAFRTISPTGYYPMDNATWTSFIEGYSGSITWVPYATAPFTLDAVAASQDLYNVDEAVVSSEAYSEQSTEGGISLFSIWDGEYGTEVTDTYILKTASFSGLVPGEQYVLLSLVSLEAEDALAPENLLYIAQDVAAEDGTLLFTYVQREATDLSYVMACGASHNNLEQAVITLPVMTASEETQVVQPTVTFNGETLTEGVDYVVVGTVDYTVAGTYTCYIRGIYNYSGTVACTYQVTDFAATVSTDESAIVYTTVEEAVNAYTGSGALKLLGDTNLDIATSKDLVLDLNGYDILGDVTAADGVTICIKDSQTDDYTVEDDFGYGRITGTVTNVTAQDGYVQIAESDGLSFHKATAALDKVSLRTKDAGIYYTGTYSYDEVVARNLAAYGVTLSTANPEPLADDSDETSLYTTSANSTLLKDIMSAENTDNTNRVNAKSAVYGRAYLKLNEGTCVYGAVIATNLQALVETVDAKMWDSLTDGQKSALADMYDTYSIAMESWNVDNLKAYSNQ